MERRPFTELIAALRPDLWANYVRAVERNQREGELRRMLEQYGRPVRFESIEAEEADGLKEAA